MKRNVLLGLVLLIVFSLGFLLGRQFPAHHYEMAMSTNPHFVLDTTTGRVCDSGSPVSQSNSGTPSGKNAAAQLLFGGPKVDQIGLPYCGRQGR